MLLDKLRQLGVRYRDRSELIILSVVATIWILACQFAFFFIQSNQGLELSKALQSQFRYELFNSDFQYLIRAVGDLEVLGTIRCPEVEQLKPHRQVLLNMAFRGGCIKNSWFLNGGRFETLAQAMNGDQYVLHFSTQNQPGFLVGLWAMRLGGLFLLVGLYLVNRLRNAQSSRIAQVQIEAAQRFNNLAYQVSHDIRSPLSALNMIVASLKEFPEDKRLIIRNASLRINDIANGLLQQSKNTRDIGGNKPLENAEFSLSAEPVMLVALVDAVVSEKRVQYRERMEIDIQLELDQAYGLFARVNPTELARVVSNLVNNSVEALIGGGRVTVAIRGDKEQVAVKVSDNGKGIPPEVLARLGERGVTHGKEGMQSGSGLGVAHARETVEQFGGTFAIESQLGIGSVITLTLPRVNTPKWFVDQITLTQGSVVVSIDDDQTIHQIWGDRLALVEATEERVNHLTFASAEKFDFWFQTNKEGSYLFLVDYEFLGQRSNGLDLIERSELGDKAILVSSRYEERDVRTRAAALGVRILPKALAPFVPLKIEKPREKFAAVLIDDDTTLVHQVWKMAAAEKCVKILCFATAEEFWAKENGIDHTTPVYIDVSLASGVRGEDVARDVIAKGFTEVFLATGYAPDSIKAPQGVRGIVGKDPIF